ncbi:MAG: hypothetical protein ACLQNG_17015 [Acidimicrobiales bacterium]
MRGPAPPASGPEPPTPALADAGYWAPPPPPGHVEQSQPSYGLSQQAYPPAGTAQPAGSPLYAPARPSRSRGPFEPYSTAYGPPAATLPPGAHTVATFSPTSPRGGPVVTISDLRANRRMQTADLASFFGAAAVLGSVFMAWYQLAYSAGGASVSVSITALTYPAGGLWRWLMLVFSIAIIVELAFTSLVLRTSSGIDWPHRSVLALLCVANLALVVGAMVVSPFNGTGPIGLLSASLGAGAYVALAGAIVGALAAAYRLLSGPPALTR